MTIEQLTLMALSAPAIPDARHALTRQLDAWVCERGQDSVLVFSELVTNAVRHAGGAFGPISFTATSSCGSRFTTAPTPSPR